MEMLYDVKSIEDYSIRLRCIELAIEAGADDPLRMAEDFAAFISAPLLASLETHCQRLYRRLGAKEAEQARAQREKQQAEEERLQRKRNAQREKNRAAAQRREAKRQTEAKRAAEAALKSAEKAKAEEARKVFAAGFGGWMRAARLPKAVRDRISAKAGGFKTADGTFINLERATDLRWHTMTHLIERLGQEDAELIARLAKRRGISLRVAP